MDLPDGTRITAVSFHEAAPYEQDAIPDFGLYLDRRWWPHAHVDWPDFGIPADDRTLRVALGDLLDRARSGQRVELGCLGAHGRTGGLEDPDTLYERRAAIGMAPFDQDRAERASGATLLPYKLARNSPGNPWPTPTADP